MRLRFEPYDGESDAEKILEDIMCRQRWSVDLRDELARNLEKIVARERMVTSARHRPGKG